MRIFLSFFSILAVFLLFSCSKDTRQTQSNLSGVNEEEKQFAQTLYGDEVKVLAKGDLLGNGKQSAIAAIVMKQTENSYWIRKGSFIVKENGVWKTILKMEEKLSAAGVDLVGQVDAKNGYIISFDTTKLPVSINIVMANEYGKGSSDEAVLKYNKDKAAFEFSTPYENIP
jgi:hypothetical protein